MSAGKSIGMSLVVAGAFALSRVALRRALRRMVLKPVTKVSDAPRRRLPASLDSDPRRLVENAASACRRLERAVLSNGPAVALRARRSVPRSRILRTTNRS